MIAFIVLLICIGVALLVPSWLDPAIQLKECNKNGPTTEKNQ